MSDVFFDVDGARAEGYSDAEIADHLGTLRNFDVEGARAEGYSDEELVHHLFRPRQRPAAPVADPFAGQSNMPGDEIPSRQASQADVRAAEPPEAAPAFDPEGADYDMQTARAAGLQPDDTGHWPSRDPATGLLLKGRKHPTWALTEQGEREAGHEIFQQGGRYYSRPIRQPAPAAGPELTDELAAQPARATMSQRGGVRVERTYQPTERPDEPGEFRKGLQAGAIGAKQMGVAAATIPNIGAMKTLAAELNAYDRIDRENQYAVPQGEGMSYVAGKARMYLSSPTETRARLRQQALERFAAHQETKDQLVQAWRAYAQENQQHKGKTVNFTDINDVSSFADWFAWNFGQGLPYMSASALSAVLGGVLGGPAGAGLGLGAAGYAMGVGDIQGELIEKGQEDQGGLALVGGVPYGALEFLGPVGRAFRMVSRGTLDNVAKSYLRRAGKEVTANAIEEFINEAGQEIIKDAAVTTATGEPLVTDESLLNWFNAGMAGAAAGGPFGAVSAIPGPDETKAPVSETKPAASETPPPAGAAPPPAAPPPGAEPDGRIEPTLRREDLDRVVADERPAREILAEEEGTAARERVEPTARAVQADELERAARVDELNLPDVGERMTVSAPTGPVTGVVESSRPTDTGWELRLRDDEGEIHIFNETDQVQISTPARRGDGTKDDPVRVTASAQIGEARAQVDPDPTPAQKEAENYRMGHIVFDEGHPYHGLPEISLETAKGGTRTAKDGSWSVPNFPADYGRFKGTEGMDGDHVDVMLGDGGKIFVIDQVNTETGAPDEHKVMLGYPTPKAARDTYIAAFTDGKGAERIGAITPMSVGQLDAFLRDPKATKRPVGEISTPDEWMEDLEWDDEHRLAGYLEDLEHDIARASDPGWRPAMREAARRIQARIRQLQLGGADAGQVRVDAGQVHAGRPAGERGEGQGRADLQRPAPARPGAGDQGAQVADDGGSQRARDGGQPAQPDSRALTPEDRERIRRQWAKFALRTRRGASLGLRSRNRFAVDERGRFRELAVDEEPKAGERVAEGQDALNALRSKRMRAYMAELRRPDPSKDSLNEWIAKTGGMALNERHDTIGDDSNQAFNTSQWLFAKRGRPADELATAAHTAGYLSDDEYNDVDGGVQALRDKIGDEFNGRRKHYAFGAEQDVGRRGEQRFEDELYARAEQLGIPTEGLSPEEVDRLVREAEAVEQAIEETESDREARLEREAIQAENLTPLEDDDGAIGFEPAEPGPGARQEAPARRQPAPAGQPLGEDAAEVGAAEEPPPDADRQPDEDEEDLGPLASLGGDPARRYQARVTGDTQQDMRVYRDAIDEVLPRYEKIGDTVGYRILARERHLLTQLIERGESPGHFWYAGVHIAGLFDGIRRQERALRRPSVATFRPHPYPSAEEPNHPVRLTAHALRRGDKAAIERAAKEMAKGLPWGAVLVPMPDHTGRADATLRLAQAIAVEAKRRAAGLGKKFFDVRVVDMLRGKPRERQYLRKKAGEPPLTGAALGLRMVGEMPKGQLYVVDNVIGTGATMRAAQEALGLPSRPLVYAREEDADLPQASEGGAYPKRPHFRTRVSVLAPQEIEEVAATRWEDVSWWEGQDYYAATINALRVLIWKGTSPEKGESARGQMPPYTVMVAGASLHLPNEGASQTLDDAKRLAFEGARLELPVWKAKNEGKRRAVPGQWVAAPPPEGDITWTGAHGKPVTGSIEGKAFAYITRAPGAKTVTLKIDGWMWEVNGKDVDHKEFRDVSLAKHHVERVLGVEREDAGEEFDHEQPDELEAEDLTAGELRDMRGEEDLEGDEPMASQGRRPTEVQQEIRQIESQLEQLDHAARRAATERLKPHLPRTARKGVVTTHDFLQTRDGKKLFERYLGEERQLRRGQITKLERSLEDARRRLAKAERIPVPAAGEPPKFTPINPAGEIPDPTNGEVLHEDPAATLICMACSSTKVDTDKPLPLLELYDGPLWQTLRSHLGNIPQENILVLSGKYDWASAGLITTAYDERLSRQRADELIRLGLNGQPDIRGARRGTINRRSSAYVILQSATDHGRRKLKNVIIVGSDVYRRAFHAIVTQMDEAGMLDPLAAIAQVEGSIGVQRHMLGEYLDAVNGKLEEETAPEIERDEGDRDELPELGGFKVGDEVQLGKERGVIRELMTRGGRERARVHWPNDDRYPGGSEQHVDLADLRKAEPELFSAAAPPGPRMLTQTEVDELDAKAAERRKALERRRFKVLRKQYKKPDVELARDLTYDEARKREAAEQKKLEAEPDYRGGLMSSPGIFIEGYDPGDPEQLRLFESRGRASLAERVEALEKRVDQAYERDDPNAEELDAELAELREQLLSAIEQNQAELDADDQAFDYSTVEEELRQAYVNWLRGGGTYGDQANARAAMRDIVVDAGGQATEEQAFDAAADAYSAAVARRVRRIEVHGGTAFQWTQDGPVLVARDVAIVQPSKWEPGATTYDFYIHTILDTATGKDIGRVTLGWQNGRVMVLPMITLWDGGMGHWRGKGRGEAVIRAILEHNGEGHELVIADISDAAMGFWRKLGVDVYDTGEGTDGALTLEAYRAARPGEARQGEPRGPAAEASQPEDARAREARAGKAQPDLTENVRAKLIEAFGPGIDALIESGFLNIVATPEGLPAHLRERTTETTEAWTDPRANNRKGAVWLIASRLDGERIIPVFLHEVGEHYGLKRILGLQGYRQLQETVRNLAKHNQVVKDAWAYVEESYPHLPVGGATFVSEVIARVGETEEGMRLPFYQRLINAVREFLVRMGLKRGRVMELSDRDIVLLIQAAARRVVDEAEQLEASSYPAQASKGGLFGGLFGGKEEEPAGPIKAQPGVSFRRLNQLLGAKLYGEPKDIAEVSVKEMVQNAFDAVKSLIDRGEIARGEINIEVDSRARTITVTDNGTGMTAQTLATTFLQVAGTQKETERSSGGLGIAKGLFLYGNERIRVETARGGQLATLETTGEALSAAADGSGPAPEIEVERAVKDAHFTTVKIWVPKSYVDASSGKTEAIELPDYAARYPVLVNSPLFSDIEVTFNGRPVPNIGASFPANEYSVFAHVKFEWGDATIYVSKAKPTNLGWNNLHYLSNGLWQFSDTVYKDPFQAWGDKIDRQIFVDINPRVRPEDSGYPFDLNRKRFTPQTYSDMRQLLLYVSLAYRREQISDQADNFGQVRYLEEGGKPGRTQALRPAKKVEDEKHFLRIVEGDTVEIEEGKLKVNGRVIPVVTKEDLDKQSLDLSKYTIDQSKITPTKVMLHDNAQLKAKGVVFSDFARAELGDRFDKVMYDLGHAFIALRNYFALNHAEKYKGLAAYGVGVSFDKSYHGVHILAPFKAVFVNPATRFTNEVVTGNEIFGTMVHELVHYTESGHGPSFVSELQRLYSHILADPIADAIRVNLVELVSDNAEVIRFLSESFKNEDIAAVGKSLEGRGQERAPGAAAGPSAAVDGRAPVEDERGAGAARGGAVDRQLPDSGEEEGPLASQGGASNIPAPDPEKFELTAKQIAEDEPPQREPGDRHWIGDISLFTKLVIHPRMLASLERSFVPVYRVAEAQVEDRDAIAHELARRIEGYMRLPEDSKTKVNAVLELDRLDEKVHLAGKEMSAKNEGHRLARLSKPGEALTLSDVEKTAYWAVRRMLDIALKMFRDQLLAELGVDVSKFKGGDIAAQILDAINPRMSDEEKANYEKAAAFANEIEQARRRGYVPFTRWGNVVIAVKNKKGTVLWAEKVEVDPVEFHKHGVALRLGRKVNQMPSVARALANVRKLFPDPGLEIMAFQIPEGPEAAASHPDIGQLDQLARVAGLEPAEWEGVRAKLEAALKARGFRKHFLGSTNVPGYSADFERAIADYITGMAGYLARRKHREAWDQAIAAIPAVKRRLQGYARKYREYMQSPQEELHLLRQIGFIYYLGMIPASAIANLTQVPLVSAPYLSQFANPAIVAGELSRAVADVALMYRPIDSGFEMFDPAAAPEDIREALQEAWARGFFVPLQTYEVQGVAYGRTPYGRKAKRALRDTRDGIAYLFSLAERTNRLTTFVAAYRLAKRRGFKGRVAEVLGKNELARAELFLEDWKPERFATWSVDETQFRMGKVNRPQIGRGYGAAILQFKGFMMQMLELWARMLSQNGVHGKTAFAASLVLWMLVAGFWGLPGAEDLRDLWEKLYRLFTHTSVDVKARMREWVYQVTGSSKLAEMFTRGAPAGAGFDLSGRVGMGNIAPDSPLQVAGIPADITAGRALRAVEHAANDSPELAWGEALPNFLRNYVTAASWLAQGVRNRRGDVVIPREQIGITDAILRGFVGVTPTWISNRRDLVQAQQRVETAINEKRDDFYERMAKARADLIRAGRANDNEAAGAAAKRIREQRAELARYNEGRPIEERIVLNDEALERRIARELQGVEAARGKGRVAARPRREQLREVYGVK